MRPSSLAFFTLVLLLLTTACSKPPTNTTGNSTAAAVRPSAPSDVAALGDFIIGDPVSHANLTVFPISSKAPKREDRFITLDEALAAGTVEILEVGGQTDESDPGEADPNAQRSADSEEFEVDDPFADPPPASRGEAGPTQIDSPANDDPFAETSGEPSGDVNQLLVLNSSGKPLYLMPGEVICGGKQNRTIGQEVIVPSGKEPVPIDVFCVESGRWSGLNESRTTELVSAVADAPVGMSLVISQTQDTGELAREAKHGNFIASAGQLDKNTRLAVQESSNQSAVWDEVAKVNAALGNSAQTGDFATAYVDAKVVENLKPYMDQLYCVGETHNIVGVAVAVNGKMFSADVYESTPLFQKFWPKLLKSYALDAVAACDGKDNGTRSRQRLTAVDCAAFIREVSASKAQTEEATGGQIVERRQTTAAVSFSYYDADAAKFGGGPGWGNGWVRRCRARERVLKVAERLFARGVTAS